MSRKLGQRSTPDDQSTSDESTPSMSGSGPLDRITSIDNEIETLQDDVHSVISQLQTTNELLAGIADQLGADDDLDPFSELYSYDLSHVVDADTTRAEPFAATWTAPYDLTIVEAIIYHPDGANQAVGTGIRDSDGNSIVPKGPSGQRYHALNDVSLHVEPDHRMPEDDQIIVESYSTDTEHPHQVSVVLLVVPDE